MTVQEAKKIILEDPGGNIAARLEAIEVAKKHTEIKNAGDLYKWAEDSLRCWEDLPDPWE